MPRPSWSWPVAALALRVRRDPSTIEEAEAAPRARDGLAFLFGDRVLSLVMIVAFSSLLFMSAVWVGELFFVQDVLGRGDVAYGLFLSIWTMGMALGALLLSPRVAAGAVAATGLAAVAVQGAGLALPALWLGFGFFLACSFVGGVAHGVKNVMFRSLIHARVPERLHGRVFAAYNGIRNSAELGAFAAGGLLVALIGPTRHARLRRRPVSGRRDRRPGDADAHAEGMGADRARRSAAPTQEVRAPRSGIGGMMRGWRSRRFVSVAIPEAGAGLASRSPRTR